MTTITIDEIHSEEQLILFLKQELGSTYYSNACYACGWRHGWSVKKFNEEVLKLNPHLVDKFRIYQNPVAALMRKIIAATDARLFIENFNKFTVEERAYLIHRLKHEKHRNISKSVLSLFGLDRAHVNYEYRSE